MLNSQKKNIIVGSIILGLIVVIGVVYFMMNGGQSNGGQQQGGDSKVGTLFYETLGNAAKQQQLRLAMYRATFASKADADAAQNPGTQSSSVGEIDVAQSKMRSVYVTNVVESPNFVIGRCIDGTTYSDDYNARKIARPTSLDAAVEAVNLGERLYQVTQPLVFIPCPNLGIMPGANADLASFRFSDGVFPVTLNAGQAENWQNKAKQADLFMIKDEGTVERDDKKLRKLSFSPKNDKSANQTLYNIFTEAAEIEKIKAENPKALYQYEFIAAGPMNTGSVGGYYLIDESTKLPVYSELYSTNPDRKSTDGASAKYNIARTKQVYTFGQSPALTAKTPLEPLR